MKLAVISHKECWRDRSSPSGYVTYGGFPLQMHAISQAFDETVLAIPLMPGSPPPGLLPLRGHNLRVLPLPSPQGQGLRRKLSVAYHAPRLVPHLWRVLDDADAVHAVVPGDVGMLGLVLALARKRPLFVRHCGLWGARRTATEHVLMSLLERYAGGRTVVMATGGASAKPSPVNSNVDWIFATSLWEDEIRGLPQATPWQPGSELRMVTVGRLEHGKNVPAVIDAVARLRADFPSLRFTVVGDGSCARAWQEHAQRAGVAELVDFIGRVDHETVLATLIRNHIFVHPTDAEGFPKAVLEAMACGLPVIATPVSVIPRLLASGAGWLIDEPTDRAIERAIRAAIADPATMARMGAVARATSLEFTLERWRDTIAERCSRAWHSPTRSDRLR
ncbi:MAG TPA: glycosyltransferase family 4 protein [Kofleriaceae bacterium]|jgi:glycosyltransferase involved in cell wall biosynthesis